MSEKDVKKPVLVTNPSIPELDEYTEELRDIWEARWLTNMGAKHNELQAGLRDYLGVKDIDLLVNGHMALELGLAALELEDGGEVITTPFTFVSTTHAIIRNGLKPVFCDISPDDYTMDVSKIESLITGRTAAILPVHVYGNVCDTDAIQDIADRHGLKVIYDAAHAFGEKYKGTGIGNFGDVSIFSFHATKVFNTIEGGAAVCKDEATAAKLRLLRNFGISSETDIDMIGANAKMNEFCAAMGICNLRHIDEEIAKRRELTSAYRKRLQDVKGIRLNPIRKDVESNHAYFPIVVEDGYRMSRDELCDVLREESIFARKYFYPLTNDCRCYSEMYDPKDTPEALEISHRVMTLPLYASLDEETVDRICGVIASHQGGI
ncbi:MAG: DegT/DnrJ/EryC1/StrS family aminotransferase [Lachnospiraceae bacterium]|nr:DegT/DnrJ/EryC1/StrS family aminotransferase [Lachnospiraceae bacterium]